jgi:hypothetical protein
MTERAAWWTHKDCGRIVARARSLLKADDVDLNRVRYLRSLAMVVLLADIPLDEQDARRLRWTLGELERAAGDRDDEERAA